jgi:hypothetical protein
MSEVRISGHDQDPEQTSRLTDPSQFDTLPIDPAGGEPFHELIE